MLDGVKALLVSYFTVSRTLHISVLSAKKIHQLDNYLLRMLFL